MEGGMRERERWGGDEPQLNERGKKENEREKERGI